MKHWGKGNFDALVNCPRVVETLLESYDQYAYLMFMLPILLNANIVVETGLGMGHSTRIFLNSLSMMNPPGTLHTYSQEIQDNKILDNHGGIPYTKIEQDIRSLNFKANWVWHKEDSSEGGKNWKGEKIKVIYLDSDHTYEHVKNELNAWTPNMAEQAVIFTDDVWAQNEPHEAINTRTRGLYPYDTYWAFEDFANHEWKQITLSYPEGKAFLLKGFGL